MIPILEIFTIVMNLIKLCPKPVVPEPVNPTPNPTPAQAKAWSEAHKLKCKANDAVRNDGYGGQGFNAAVRDLMKEKRRDGEKIKRKEAVEAVSQTFDDARSSTMADLYGDVLEFNHAA